MWFARKMRCAAFAIFAGALLGAGPAAAQSASNKTVYLLSWGGSIQKSFEQGGLAEAFEKETGYKVVVVPKAESPEIIATAIAQKDKPQVDVVMVEIVSFMQGVDRDIFASVTEKDLPNLAKMYDFAKVSDKGSQIVAGVPVVVYHEAMFKKAGWAPPTSFADLERPELKGKILLPPCCTSFGLYITIELARLHGGSEKNMEPGFAALKAIAPGVVDWPATYARVGELMEGEEAAIAVWGTTGAWELINKGVPIKIVPPNPVYLQTSAVGVMKNAPNPQGALVLANWLMGDRHLGYRAEHYGEIPLNRETKFVVNPDRRLDPRSIENSVRLDYDYINKHRAEWLERFTREILRR